MTSQQPTASAIILLLVFTAPSSGCRSAGNHIPGLPWVKRATPASIASAPATTTTIPETVLVTADSQIAGGTASSDAGENAAQPWQNDPLSGFYPKNDSGDTLDASAGGAVSTGWSSATGSSRSGSFTPTSAAGCSSGCCPR